MKIEKFEDIKAWQIARELVREVYKITNKDKFAKDFGLKDQIRRASVSIMSNISEGCERGSDKEFNQFLNYARGSAAEVKSQLYIALDLEHIDEFVFKKMHDKCTDISKLIMGFINYLKKT
ncbi:MAG: four helix bundle protein [Thermodesulfobacteriota bacterium]|nr:four helix bundle protein [Thermodesulfobacteriota bacterium]